MLGAALQHGRPSPVLAARIDHALALFRSGTVKWLIFTGATGEGQSVSEARASSIYAVERGISSSRILLDEASKTTLENLSGYVQEVTASCEGA